MIEKAKQKAQSTYQYLCKAFNLPYAEQSLEKILDVDFRRSWCDTHAEVEMAGQLAEIIKALGAHQTTKG